MRQGQRVSAEGSSQHFSAADQACDLSPDPAGTISETTRKKISVALGFAVFGMVIGAVAVAALAASLKQPIAIESVSLAALPAGLLFFAVAFIAFEQGQRQSRNLSPENGVENAETMQDLTQQVRELRQALRDAEAKAHAANRAKQAFMAQVNHDIRTPLNHILGFAELIRTQAFGAIGDRRYLAYVEDIRHSGELLLGFFSRILEYADVSHGRRALRPGTIEFDALRTEICAHHGQQAARAGIKLTLNMPSDLVLETDLQCLIRVLDNLVSNAVKFTGRGGKVEISAFAIEDHIAFKITDTGIGIGHDQLQQLNLPHSFDDMDLRDNKNGHGLGVAMARTMTELCGGELKIDSVVGIGTTVVVMLPSRAPQLVEQVMPDEPDRSVRAA